MAAKSKVRPMVDSAKARRSMAAESAKERERQQKRDTSLALVQMVEGRDTPEANWARRTLSQVAETDRRVRVAGDPLNLTGHTKKKRISAAQARRQRKEKAKRYVTILLPGGGKAMFDLKSNPIAGIYRNGGVQAPHFGAAARWQEDFQLATYAGMKSASFDPKVDGGRTPGANLRAVEAQGRRRDLSKMLGAEGFMLLDAICGYALTLSDIEAAKGENKKVLSSKLRHYLSRAATYYGYQEREPESSTFRALQKLLTKMAAEVGEHVT